MDAAAELGLENGGGLLHPARVRAIGYLRQNRPISRRLTPVAVSDGAFVVPLDGGTVFRVRGDSKAMSKSEHSLQEKHPATVGGIGVFSPSEVCQGVPVEK